MMIRPPFLMKLLSLRYPSGALWGICPVCALVLSHLTTFILLLSFSSFAWEQRIMRRNFSFGAFLKVWPLVRISWSLHSSMRSTTDPRSQAFLESLSGAHERIELYRHCLSHSRRALNPSRAHEAFADLLSRIISTTLSPSRSATFLIASIWESSESACRSSSSDDFLTYKQ